jgi:hypothetical protein
MWIEAMKPLCVQFKSGDVHLRPGLPVEFDEVEGQRLLARAPGKVKVVTGTTAPLFAAGSPVLVGSGIPWCALVAWTLPQSPGGTTQAGWWYCVEAGARWALVHESRLSAERAPVRLTD